jgi:hypothetical protein
MRKLTRRRDQLLQCCATIALKQFEDPRQLRSSWGRGRSPGARRRNLCGSLRDFRISRSDLYAFAIVARVVRSRAVVGRNRPDARGRKPQRERLACSSCLHTGAPRFALISLARPVSMSFAPTFWIAPPLRFRGATRHRSSRRAAALSIAICVSASLMASRFFAFKWFGY